MNPGRFALAFTLAASLLSSSARASDPTMFPLARLGVGIGGGWAAAWSGARQQLNFNLAVSGEWALDDARTHAFGLVLNMRDFTKQLEMGPFGSSSPVFDLALVYRYTLLGDRAVFSPFGRAAVGIALQNGCGEVCGDNRYWTTSAELGVILRTSEQIALALSGVGTIHSGAPLGFVPWSWQGIIALTLLWDPGGAPL